MTLREFDARNPLQPVNYVVHLFRSSFSSSVPRFDGDFVNFVCFFCVRSSLKFEVEPSALFSIFYDPGPFTVVRPTQAYGLFRSPCLFPMFGIDSSQCSCSLFFYATREQISEIGNLGI